MPAEAQLVGDIKLVLMCAPCTSSMEGWMSKYELGRDIQELRSRIEYLERSRIGAGSPDVAEDRQSLGRIEVAQHAGVDPQREAIIWKPDKGVKIPPVLYAFFGHGPEPQFNIRPETRSWSCVPEPLIINVTWDRGGTEEHCRFVDQVFSIVRFVDPNTHITTANFIYSARLITASGRSIDYAGGSPGGPGGGYVPPHYVGPSMGFTLRSSSGAGLFSYALNFSVACHGNLLLNLVHDFPPGLYDLVEGATWQFNTWRVARC
jgi:hypothetical protein